MKGATEQRKVKEKGTLGNTRPHTDQGRTFVNTAPNFPFKILAPLLP